MTSSGCCGIGWAVVYVVFCGHTRVIFNHCLALPHPSLKFGRGVAFNHCLALLHSSLNFGRDVAFNHCLALLHSSLKFGRDVAALMLLDKSYNKVYYDVFYIDLQN